MFPVQYPAVDRAFLALGQFAPSEQLLTELMFVAYWVYFGGVLVSLLYTTVEVQFEPLHFLTTGYVTAGSYSSDGFGSFMLVELSRTISTLGWTLCPKMSLSSANTTGWSCRRSAAIRTSAVSLFMAILTVRGALTALAHATSGPASWPEAQGSGCPRAVGSSCQRRPTTGASDPRSRAG